MPYAHTDRCDRLVQALSPCYKTYLIGILESCFVDMCGENMITPTWNHHEVGYTSKLSPPFCWLIPFLYHQTCRENFSLTDLLPSSDRGRNLEPRVHLSCFYEPKVADRGMICTKQRNMFFCTHALILYVYNYYIQYIIYIYIYVYTLYIYTFIYSIEREREREKKKRNNYSKFLVWGLCWQYHTFCAVVTVVVDIFKGFLCVFYADAVRGPYGP